MKIIPAVLEKSFEELKNKLDFLVENKNHLDFDFVQIDLCDGNFVKSQTWLPNVEDQKEKEIINSYRKYFGLEFHLMCDNQKKYFERIKDLNAKLAVVHLDKFLFGESDKKYFLDLLLESEDSPTRIIFTANLNVMIDKKDIFLDFLKEIRGFQEKIFVQVMGIENIGEQGQDFDVRSVEMIKTLRDNFSKEELFIQIDGSINSNTINLVREAGVDGVVVGSYLLRDLDENIFLSNYQRLL